MEDVQGAAGRLVERSLEDKNAIDAEAGLARREKRLQDGLPSLVETGTEAADLTYWVDRSVCQSSLCQCILGVFC